MGFNADEPESLPVIYYGKDACELTNTRLEASCLSSGHDESLQSSMATGSGALGLQGWRNTICMQRWWTVPRE